MVCDIQTQLLQGERNGVVGGLRLTVFKATQEQPLWRCELRGEQVEVDCGHGPCQVSSRTALKMLLQELILRSALSDDAALAFSTTAPPNHDCHMRCDTPTSRLLSVVSL